MKRAQSTAEFAMIISIVAAALLAMSTYLYRSVQADLKLMEDKINAQTVPE